MSTLQELLNRGLVDIGSDDSRFEKLKSAASALATRFKEDPELLLRATLISLDDSVHENDPMFAQVEELVIAEWKTLRNTHVNRPRELLRSIVVDALATATNGNAKAAGAVWNTAASPLRHGQARLGQAAPVVQKVIQDAGQFAESEAVARSGLVVPGSDKRGQEKAPFERVPFTVKGTIADEDLLKDVGRAAGPQNPQGQGLEAPNPHWTNQAPQWSYEFTPRMTAALVKAVNLGTGRLAESVAQGVASYLSTFDAELLREVEQLRNDMSQMRDSSRMRLDVLWWSESLYSPSLQVSYRDLPLPVAAVAAAGDLTKIVPALAPASVCYVLGETVLRLSHILDETGDQPVSAYLKGLADERTDFGDSLPRSSTPDARSPLLDLVGEASSGQVVPPKILRSRTGVDGALKLSSAEFAMWVFRDLQARRLVKELR